MSEVRHQRDGHILVITIDNPSKKNSFTPGMMAQLSAALTELNDDPGLRVGVLAAAGPDFTAGLDMPQFFGPGATPIPRPPGAIDPFGLENRCAKPLVTAVQGICFTVGIEMALAGDIVIAADNTRFCQMEARRGIAPLGGAHFRYIARAGWGNGLYHLLLCDEFGAAEAWRIGLVQEVVPAGEQLARAMAVAHAIAANAPLGIQATKAAALRYVAEGETAAIAAIPDFRDRVLASADAAEGIMSFIERRAAVFTGR
ncbi:enoyl-CoA hydratase [alpha proteobacterium AAP81b]|nr:enoyl-CoA hydratase [alpha proteobacterium AAP81b]